jgi:hypothetical protein
VRHTQNLSWTPLTSRLAPSVQVPSSPMSSDIRESSPVPPLIRARRGRGRIRDPRSPWCRTGRRATEEPAIAAVPAVSGIGPAGKARNCDSRPETTTRSTTAARVSPVSSCLVPSGAESASRTMDSRATRWLGDASRGFAQAARTVTRLARTPRASIPEAVAEARCPPSQNRRDRSLPIDAHWHRSGSIIGMLGLLTVVAATTGPMAPRGAIGYTPARFGRPVRT